MSKLRMTTMVALFLILSLSGPLPAHAGAAAVGSVAGSLNASMGGQALLPNSVIFSGDVLQVKDGAAVVALERGSRMAVGRESQVSFLRESKGLTVLLDSGNLSIYHPASGGAVRIRAGQVEVRPEAGYLSLGEVALSHGVIFVTAKKGVLRVEGNGRSVELAQGKSLSIEPRTSGFPQGGPAANAGAPQTGSSGSDRTWRTVGLAAGGTGVILGAVALGRAGSSNSTANSALSTATAAASAATAATAAATAAAQAAAAATSVAELSITLQELSNNILGCKLNALANELGQVSPYTPPPGFSCGR